MRDKRILDLDKASNMKQGYLAAVKPAGDPWGHLEKDPKRFMRIIIPENQFDPRWLQRPEDDLTDRIFRFDVRKLLSRGEFEALMNIPYNEKTSRPEIIKSFSDISKYIGLVDWSNPPELIKLHGSSGTFSVQEGGGGDYTSLITAVETEAASMTADVNFIISGAWTAADTANWDIDGYTMNGYNMLIQTQGASRSSNGIYSTSAYRILGVSEVFDIETENCTIDGLQWQLTATAGIGGIQISGGISSTTILFDHCICDGNGQAATGIINDSSIGTGVTVNVHNSVFLNSGQPVNSEGIFSTQPSTTWNIRNCSIAGWDDGIEQDDGTVNVTNSAVFNNTTDFDEAAGMTVTYTASDDGHAGTGNVTITQSASNYAALVTNLVGGDLSVTDSGSEIYNAGSDLSGSGVTDDILGTARPQATTYDIGAFELVAAGGFQSAWARNSNQIIGVSR